MRRGLASPGRDAGRMAACRRHLPGACNTSSPPPGLTEPSGACRHRVAADRPRRAGRAILSFSIGGAGGVQSGMGCAGGAGKKLLAAMPPQWRISANLFRRQGGESGRGARLLGPISPQRGRTDAPRPHRAGSPPHGAPLPSVSAREEGEPRRRRRCSAALLPPLPPVAGRLRGGAGAILGAVSPPPPPLVYLGTLETPLM